MFLPLRRARWPLHTKMGRICKVAVEMTRRINRGESQTGYSPALGNPHQTRVPTFSQRRRRRGAWQRRGQTPLKSGSLPDSCTEPISFLQPALYQELFAYWVREFLPVGRRSNLGCRHMMPSGVWLSGFAAFEITSVSNWNEIVASPVAVGG